MVGGSLLSSAVHREASAGADGLLARVGRLPAPAPAVMALLAEAVESAAGPADRFDFLATDPRFARAYLGYLADSNAPSASPPSGPLDGIASVFELEQILRSTSAHRPCVGAEEFALACATITDFSARLPCGGGRSGRRAFTPAVFWRHSMAVAVMARELTWHTTTATDEAGVRQDCATAFACGLWHDIGKLILAHLYPKTYDRVCERAGRGDLGICDAEAALLGSDHTLVGKRAATAWACPEPVVRGIWLHHQGFEHQPLSPLERLPATIQLADALVRRAAVGLTIGRADVDIAHLVESLGLDLAQLEDVCDPWLAEAERMADAALASLGGDVGCDDQSAAPSPAYRAPVGEFWMANRAAVSAARFATAASIWDSALARSPDPADAAGEAARAIGSLLEATAGLVLVPEGDGDWLVAAWANDGGISDAVADSRLKVEALAGRVAFAPLAIGPIRDESVMRCWAQAFGSAPEQGLYMVPIACRSRWQAVCVFSAAEVESRTHECDPHQLRALCESIGLGLVNVAARCESDRMAERLADGSRRLSQSLPQRVRANTVAALAATAAGAAHELNNPLAVISGRAQLLLATTEDPDVARHVRIIKEQADRAAAMALDLMTYAKPPAPVTVETPLRPLIEAACQHCGERFGLLPGQFDVRFADPGLAACLDADHFRRILEALLANAAAALPPQGGLIIVNSTSRATDEKVRIVVEDNGGGMSREVLERAFDPFFSHRAAGRGRGMGLSIASRLAEAGGGRITLNSRPDEGTVAVIELPTAPLHA
jgi:signal transduction histidine kinase